MRNKSTPQKSTYMIHMKKLIKSEKAKPMKKQAGTEKFDRKEALISYHK